MVENGKNPSEFYDVNYLKGRMSMEDKASVRWEDNGLFYNAALFTEKVASLFGAKRILDVGCGRGFLVNHLRNLGFTADGLEYGKAALENSVCGASFCDLTDRLPVPDGSYDIVLCHGVLSHIPELDVPHAALELRRVTRLALWLNVITEWAPTQVHHRTFRPEAWWRERFLEVSFAPMDDFRPLLEGAGFNRDGTLQYSALWSPI